MRNMNILAAIVFALAVAVIIAIELTSTEYAFTPDQSSTATSTQSQPSSAAPLEELISRYSRTTGSLDAGNAQVNVVFLNPIRNLESDSLFFQIDVNTYSLDLSEYDIVKMVVLEDDNGKKIIDGFEWELLHRNHNHHLMGILTAPDLKGGRSIMKEAAFIKLTIEGIPNIEKREFRWNNPVSWRISGLSAAAVLNDSAWSGTHSLPQ